MQHNPIKAKIIELVPSLVPDCSAVMPLAEAHITIAHVLRAIDDDSILIGSTGEFLEATPAGALRLDCAWNLTTNYDGQTQEVKDFIGNLLGV